jgi:predicted negative regulator of RcsB-dependent stress response
MIELAGTDSKSFAESGNTFIAENGASSYASLTALALAKNAADHKDWPQVEIELKAAIDKAVDDGIKAIATIRLARVQLQLAKFDDALTTLAGNLPASFTASIEEVKGDIYLKQEKTELARNAYQAAIDSAGESANPVLQMKLDDLAQVINLSK